MLKGAYWNLFSYLSIYLSIHQSIYPSIYLSIHLRVCRCVYSVCSCSTVVWCCGIKRKALLQTLQKLSGERLGKKKWRGEIRSLSTQKNKKAAPHPSSASHLKEKMRGKTYFQSSIEKQQHISCKIKSHTSQLEYNTFWAWAWPNYFFCQPPPYQLLQPLKIFVTWEYVTMALGRTT